MEVDNAMGLYKVMKEITNKKFNLTGKWSG